MKPITMQIQTGRIILLTKKLVFISETVMGEIYPKSKGLDVVSYLSQVYSEKDFKRYVSSLLIKQYGFRKKGLFTSIPTKELINQDCFDFPKLNYEQVFSTDWLYIKNLTNTGVLVYSMDGYEVLVSNYETVALNCGNALPYPFKKPLKEKDTVRRILLTEKTNKHE